MGEEDDTKTVKSRKSKTSAKTKRTTKTAAGEEDEAAQPVEEEEETLMRFLWNPDKKEVMGRGAFSWLLITLFYICFFICLAAFFVFSWYVSLVFIDPNVPNKSGAGSILHGKGPGLSFRPCPDREHNKQSALILVQTGSAEASLHWVKQLKDWFKYMPEEGFKGTKTCSATDKAGKESCIVPKNVYGDCGEEPFGYDKGEPCILIKINRIFGWTPTPISEDAWKTAMDKGKVKTDNGDVRVRPGLKYLLKDKGASIFINRTAIWCEGESDLDNEHMGSIEFHPGPFIENYYFPFNGQTNYQSPFVMIQLKRPMPGTLISIVCKAYAKNLATEKETKVGYTRFHVLVG